MMVTDPRAVYMWYNEEQHSGYLPPRTLAPPHLEKHHPGHLHPRPKWLRVKGGALWLGAFSRAAYYIFSGHDFGHRKHVGGEVRGGAESVNGI